MSTEPAAIEAEDRSPDPFAAMESIAAMFKRRWPEFYERQVERVVQRLRDLADRVQREGTHSLAAPGANFPAAASAVAHEITWGVANLSIEELLRAAFDADRASQAAKQPRTVEV